MRYIFTAFLFSLLLCCKTQRLVKPIKKSNIFNQGFTGCIIYDKEKDRTLFAMNEDKYFTPASNTKLFTFYTAYKILGNNVNSLNYSVGLDSLIFWGTGNPAFLHPDFQDGSVLELLKSTDKKLYWADNSHEVMAYGPGWSWDWYEYYFGPQRSALPMYGNVVRFSKKLSDADITFYPPFFEKNIVVNNNLFTTTYKIGRAHESNRFEYTLKGDSLEFETDKPYITSPELTLQMLEDTLERKVERIDYDLVRNRPHAKLRGIETDTLFKQMLTYSDNFLAEQLLFLASDQLFDSLNIGKVIDYSIDHFLADLPDKPIWRDGSGLSHYNKFTPRSVLSLLKKIWKEVPEEKIYAFFPAGGKSGTIKSWYSSGNDFPYIYAKTGTLNGVHCLSGYLLTKSKKVLFFSFMHNNYITGSTMLKKEMEKVLFSFYQKY